ncbi:cellulase family glycosylhydrolase [Rhodococcoides yunnanense]|uniref:cellulase family glycosylhydrolase n=1 Tax=Rhodococcoides yunnanense TaxID=278209 RepID=UPI001FE45B4D|nr:cellulase family glycosylhydrolase [Rhodococcus yunnanensis]
MPEPSPVTAPDTVSVWNSVGLAVNAASSDMPGADARRDIEGIADAGFDAVRLVVEWSEIEPVAGELEWSDTDSAVDAASARGLPILGVLTWAPTWAVPPNYALTAHPAPDGAEGFAGFASAAAARYRDRITAWEVWNEPNVAASFGPSADPQRYCALLSAASHAIRTASPTALVVAGPTSPAVDSVNDVSPATFVDALYRCAGPDTFDAVAMHPYSTPNLLSRPDAAWSSAHEIARVRAVMERRGDDGTRIWFTEFGAPTSAASPGVDEQRQSEILVDGITALHALPYAGPIFVFDFRDSMTGSPVPDYNYGLVRSDFTEKPALRSVLDLPR